MITRHRNTILQSIHGKPFAADVFYKPTNKSKPIVIFCHGFKGFKDWGPFDQVADTFVDAGFVYVKFNFSHNGTTLAQPLDFADLEAFGNNNMSIELDDLGVVIDWINSPQFILNPSEINTNKIYLLGHSRGGGIVILKAKEDTRIKKIATWASVNEFGKFWTGEQLETMNREGVLYTPNARTNQQMPLYAQLYKNYFDNLPRLFIPDAVKQTTIPFLVIHGTEDEAVPFSTALQMHQWNNTIQLLLLEHAKHTFGGKHPFNEQYLPDDLEDACKATIDFFKE